LWYWSFLLHIESSSPASRTTLEQVSVVKKTVEHGADRGGIPEQLTPVLNRPIRSHQRAGPLVASHNEFEQFLGRRQRELAHAEIVEEEQRHSYQRLQAEERIHGPQATDRGYYCNMGLTRIP